MIPSNNRRCILIAFLLFFSSHAFSQDTISISYRDKIEVTTSLGVSIPRSDFMKHSNIGIRTMTGFQYRYNKSIFFRAVYEISLYSFTNSRSVDGFSVVNKGNRSLIGAFVDAGLKYKLWETELKLGALLGFGIIVAHKPLYRGSGKCCQHQYAARKQKLTRLIDWVVLHHIVLIKSLHCLYRITAFQRSTAFSCLWTVSLAVPISL
jgi:hypothetical protein